MSAVDVDHPCPGCGSILPHICDDAHREARARFLAAAAAPQLTVDEWDMAADGLALLSGVIAKYSMGGDDPRLLAQLTVHLARVADLRERIVAYVKASRS